LKNASKELTLNSFICNEIIIVVIVVIVYSVFIIIHNNGFSRRVRVSCIKNVQSYAYYQR